MKNKIIMEGCVRFQDCPDEDGNSELRTLEHQGLEYMILYNFSLRTPGLGIYIQEIQFIPYLI